MWEQRGRKFLLGSVGESHARDACCLLDSVVLICKMETLMPTSQDVGRKMCKGECRVNIRALRRGCWSWWGKHGALTGLVTERYYVPALPALTNMMVFNLPR